MSLDLPGIHNWHRGVARSNARLSLIGLAVLFGLAFGFGSWSVLAPLQSAVVTTGTFVASGQNKQIQHLEGGIIKDVLIGEGEIVQAGDILVRLDDTSARARLRRLILRRYRLLAIQRRLEAQIYDEPNIRLPAELTGAIQDQEVAALLDRQAIELRARRDKLAAEQDVLRKEIAGLNESIGGFKAQLKANSERLALFQTELTDKSELLDRQLARKIDVLALQRSQAALVGEIGELTGRIADSRERIARAEQQIVSLKSTATQQAVEELSRTETELDDVSEQLRAAQDIVDRVDIRAPVHGAVVKLNHNTQGGVIAPGGVILELLPMNEDLVIEARISPREISHVQTGQDAMIRLTALNQRVVPMVEGRVIYLSPDTVSEQARPNETADAETRINQSFVVRIKLSPEQVAAKVSDFRPTPGMPADVFIKTAERTFFDYIMRPVLESFSRAFREA